MLSVISIKMDEQQRQQRFIYIYLELLFLGEKWINYIHIQHEIPIPLWNDSRVCKCTVHKEMNVCVHRFEIHTIWKILVERSHLRILFLVPRPNQDDREREREGRYEDSPPHLSIHPTKSRAKDNRKESQGKSIRASC